MMFFTLADLYKKVVKGRWQGQVSFYPSHMNMAAEDLEAFSQQLDAKLSLTFGEPVLVMDTPCPNTLMSILYLWHKGAVVVPVRHTMSSEARQQIASDCQAQYCLNQGEVISLACSQKQQDSELEANSQAMGQASDQTKSQATACTFQLHSKRRVTGGDLALIIYTSGSTGSPKGIMLSHQNVLTALHAIGQYLDLDEQEHILCLSPLSFDYGLYQCLFSLAFDCRLTLFEEDFHPIKVIKALTEQEISLLPVVPAMATSLMKLITSFKTALPALRKITNTGGHLGQETIDKIHAQLPHVGVYAMYGLTECKRALYLAPEESQRKMGSVGKPMPGLEAKIFTTHPNNQGFVEVQQGEVGELFVRGSSLMQGYYGQANGGASLYQGQYRDDNWLATGDLFMQDEEGFFYFKGRSKELIKQAGFCLYPAELEALIEQNDNVALCAVVSGQDKWGDEIACLHVQLVTPGAEQEAAFKDWLARTLDDNYRPRQVDFTEKMRLTQNAKIDRQSLIANLSSG